MTSPTCSSHAFTTNHTTCSRTPCSTRATHIVGQRTRLNISLCFWSHNWSLSLTLTLRLHVERQPSLGRRQCETKTSASGAKLYKIITQLHHNAGSWAGLSYWPHCWDRVYATSLLVQSWRGYARVRAPAGFQSNTRLTHRFEGKFATCIANFQWCLRHCSDQVVNPCCCASATAFPFQWCRISCQGAFHSTKFSGPTIMRSILR